MVAKSYIDGYLNEFRSKFPKVNFIFSQEENIDFLKQKKLDFIINFDYLFRDTGFSTIDIFNKEIEGYFVASKNYAQKHGLDKPITKSELIKHPIIDRKEPLQKHLSLLGIDANAFEAVIEVKTEGQIPSMVKHNIGIGMLNKYALQDLNEPDIVKLQITDLKPSTARLVCAYNSTLSRPAKAFIDGLLKFCKNELNV